MLSHQDVSMNFKLLKSYREHTQFSDYSEIKLEINNRRLQKKMSKYLIYESRSILYNFLKKITKKMRRYFELNDD